jgi:hypothetical protein
MVVPSKGLMKKPQKMERRFTPMNADKNRIGGKNKRLSGALGSLARQPFDPGPLAFFDLCLPFIQS